MEERCRWGREGCRAKLSRCYVTCSLSCAGNMTVGEGRKRQEDFKENSHFLLYIPTNMVITFLFAWPQCSRGQILREKIHSEDLLHVWHIYLNWACGNNCFATTGRRQSWTCSNPTYKGFMIDLFSGSVTVSFSLLLSECFSATTRIRHANVAFNEILACSQGTMINVCIFLINPFIYKMSENVHHNLIDTKVQNLVHYNVQKGKVANSHIWEAGSHFCLKNNWLSK